MARPKDSTFKKQARVLKALANESRLKIIDRLSRGQCSVGELTELVGLDPSTVSSTWPCCARTASSTIAGKGTSCTTHC